MNRLTLIAITLLGITLHGEFLPAIAAPEDSKQQASEHKHQSLKGKYVIWQQAEGDGTHTTHFRFQLETRPKLPSREENTLFYQFAIEIYNGEKLVGTHYRWERGLGGVGSLQFELLGANTNYEIKEGWRTVLKVRYVDTAWDTKNVEPNPLEEWFSPTWWKFNSVDRIDNGHGKRHGYHWKACATPGLPDFVKHLEESKVSINCIYTFESEGMVLGQEPKD